MSWLVVEELLRSSTSASSGPRRNLIGLRLRHESADVASRKMTRLVLGAERVSYLRFLKYSTSPNWETSRRISRDSLMLDGRGLIRRWTARPAVGRARDAMAREMCRVVAPSPMDSKKFKSRKSARCLGLGRTIRLCKHVSWCK